MKKNISRRAYFIFLALLVLPLMVIPLLGHARKLGGAKQTAQHREARGRTLSHGGSSQSRQLTSVESTAGVPEYRRASLEAEHAIVRATVYSDRALIVRRALIKPTQGSSWVHFGFLPNDLDRTSIKLRTLGKFPAQISQVVLEESFENVGLAPDTKKKVTELRNLYASQLELQQQRRGVEQARDFVTSIPFEAPFKREPAAIIPRNFNVKINTLETSLHTLKEQDSRLALTLVEMKERERQMQEHIDSLVTNLEQITSATDQRWVLHGYFLLENVGNQALPIELSYFAPNAKWYPTYDLRAQLNRRSGTADVTLVTAALVEQKTQENWKDVSLSLSTLDPIPLWLPKFTRWILKENRVAEQNSIAADSLAVDGGGSAQSSLKSEESFDESEQFAGQPQRTNQKNIAMAKTRPALTQSAPAPAAKMQLSGKQSRAAMRDRKMGINQNARMESESDDSETIIQKQEVTSDEIQDLKETPSEDVANKLDSESVSPLANQRTDKIQKLEQLYPFLHKIERTLSKFEQERKFRSVSTEQAASFRSKNIYSDANLPVVLAKGRVIEYNSPLPVTVEPNTEPFKTPVATTSLKGKLQYYCVPKMDNRVFLKAKIDNSSKNPILAGAAHIFMDGDLVSETSLPTVDPKNNFSVSLGVDPNVETKRIVTKKAIKEGLIAKQHVTEVKVALELVNHHPFPIEMELHDNYPQSSNEKLVVKLQDFSIAPQEKKDGLIKWTLMLAPQEKKNVSFNYQVSHPEDALVSEFN